MSGYRMGSRRMGVLGIAVMALVAAGCRGSAKPGVSSAPPSAAVYTNTLHVTVNAGGDCGAAEDSFVLRANDPDMRGDHVVATSTGTVVMASPGIVPCSFSFDLHEVPLAKTYVLVDSTQGVGWGPWSRPGLASQNWTVEVDLTDTD